LRFARPVRNGDTIVVRAELVEIIPERRREQLSSTCTNQLNEVVLDGEATMLVPRPATAG
jgi:acyl dehydratase